MAEPRLLIGNTASPAKDKKRYNWVLYVRGATEYIESVTVKLHHSFKDPVRTREEAPFEFKSRGWGTFDIDILIKVKGGSNLRTSWELQFDLPDASKELLLPIPAAPSASCPSAHAAPSLAAPPVPSENWDAESSHSDILGVRGGIAGLDSADEAVDTESPVITEEPDLPGDPPSLLRSTSAGKGDDDPSRAAFCTRLSETPFMAPSDPYFMHGRAYSGALQSPTIKWKSDKPPRKDHSCPKWLTATEFEDVPDVLSAKVKQLAQLILVSRKTVAYTGAGISASVIGQAALSGENKVGWKDNTRAAPPTFTHHCLGFLGREGLLHGWVQQNHDGLPQKAGFPQERINEIHGSWYDPSNPVVKYSGSLHDRSYPWMREDANTADLCLVLGTSLGGLNADQVATKTAERSLLPPAPPAGVLAPGAWISVKELSRKGAPHIGVVTAVQESSLQVRFRLGSTGSDDDDSEEEDDRLSDPVELPRATPLELLPAAGGGLGTVIMNLQQTAQDGKMTLRLFGKSDDILRMLLPELGFSLSIVQAPVWPKVSRALVPYDSNGRRLSGTGKRMWLDLRKAQEVRITPGHNIQGANQPQYMHIGATKPVVFKGETRQPGAGIGSVISRSNETSSFLLRIEGVQMRLGIWWLESAMRGGVDVLPIVNQNPLFED
eukprot:TRINITY_DN105558_c0_g1_i1.p1 TRINITY_DN105558_c0_g1~~TRINITY_DN105558_c0_g1_i1.p1  ORF type:complete len:664 (+),score=122.53 TRINITY_DN105558_c0_g1_i1:42-2033(+)